MADFISLRWLDFLDILLVAFLIFQLYKIVKGTVAIRIFLGIFAIYLFWKVVEALKMELLTEILGQLIGVGVIALIIVFQQELRRFLLLIGTPGFLQENETAKKLFSWFKKNDDDFDLDYRTISKALKSLSKAKTGVLIVIEKSSNLDYLADSGIEIDAKISKDIIENIFFKNTPMHDGAMLIVNNRIKAARCILPISEQELEGNYGMRHRAALGISENSDCLAVIVSEETGEISFASNGKLIEGINQENLEQKFRSFLY